MNAVMIKNPVVFHAVDLNDLIGDLSHHLRSLGAQLTSEFQKRLDSRSDMKSALLLNTAFRSGMMVRLTSSLEGRQFDITADTSSKLSSVLSAVITDDVIMECSRDADVSPGYIKSTVNNPGKSDLSFLVWLLKASEVEMRLAPSM